jgi:hypothetical protein
MKSEQITGGGGRPPPPPPNPRTEENTEWDNISSKQGSVSSEVFANPTEYLRCSKHPNILV